MNESLSLGKFDNEESRKVVKKALSEKGHSDNQISKIKKIEEEITNADNEIINLKKNAEIAGKTRDYDSKKAQIKLVGENYKRYREIKRITDQINDFPMVNDEESEEVVNTARIDSRYDFNGYNKKIEDLDLEIELIDNLIVSKEKNLDEKNVLLTKKRKLEEERNNLLS